jgi:hypothetical protein
VLKHEEVVEHEEVEEHEEAVELEEEDLQPEEAGQHGQEHGLQQDGLQTGMSNETISIAIKI